MSSNDAEKITSLLFQGKVHEAQDILADLIAEAQDNRDLSAEATWRNLLAFSNYRQGKSSNALLEYQTACKLAEQAKNLQELGNALNGIGNVISDLGRLAEALQYYYRALPIREQQNDYLGIAGSLNSIGTVHYLRGELQEAEENYSKALFWIRKANSARHAAMVLFNMGLLFWSMGNLNEAERSLSEAIDVCRENKIQAQPYDHALGALACVFAEKGKASDAAIFLNEAEQLVASLDLPKASLNFSKGFVTMAANDFVGARAYFRQGFSVAEEVGDADLAVRSLLHLASLEFQEYQKTLSERQLRVVSDHLTQARDYAVAKDQRLASVKINVLLALLKAHEFAFEEAYSIAIEAEEMAEKFGMLSERSKAKDALQLISSQESLVKVSESIDLMEKASQNSDLRDVSIRHFADYFQAALSTLKGLS